MLKVVKGCLVLIIPKTDIEEYLKLYEDKVPEEYKKYKIKRDGDNYHITIVSSQEKFDKNKEYNIESKYLVLGLGKSKKDAYYLIIHFPEGDKIRKELGLTSCDFHITLGFNQKDDHESSKNVSTLEIPYIKNIDKVLNMKSPNITKWSRLLETIIKTDLYSKSSLKSEDWLFSYVTTLANQQNFSGVNTYLPLLLDKNLIMGHYINLKIKEVYQQLTENEIIEVYESLKNTVIDEEILSKKHIQYVNTIINILNSNVGYELKTKFIIRDKKIFKLTAPRNLTKIIVPNELKDKCGHNIELYASGMISQNHIEFIQEFGFDMVLNLTEKPGSVQKAIHKIYHNAPIDDRKPPSMEQMYQIVNNMDSHKKVIVHCVGGKGRTNTILIAYLIWKYDIYYKKAYNMVINRNIVLTEPQVKFLAEFEKNEMKYKGIRNIKINNKIKPDVIMIIGLPCSGKSTFSQHLMTHCPNNMIYLNQDEMGRGKYHKSLMQNLDKNIKNNFNIVLIDKCNTHNDEREVILSIAKKNKLNVLGLWFDISLSEIILRAKSRKDHPVLSSPQKTEEVIKSKQKDFVEPRLNEGFKELLHMKDEDQINDLLVKWGIPSINLYQSNYFKFPRTRHLYSLGSAQRNDLIMTLDEVKQFHNIELYIEEKIDGANIGISIDPETQIIKFQNRSHYVNESTHLQFSKLPQWVNMYGPQLYEVIEPGRHILFGEWLYLRHTVPYNGLPSYFVVFDMYDKKEKVFYSRNKIEKILSKTKIPLVPLIFNGSFNKKEDIVKLLEKDSTYGNTLIEGLYIKVPNEDNTSIIRRGKIVRSDFLSEDTDFWDKNTSPNGLIDGVYI
jgi:predicted kinase